MITAIYINNDRLDLFQDESITVQSSILDSQDITKNTGDYTRDFTVPANDNNNQIFKHYYNATIDNSFDARTKIDGKIELDGLPFKRGKFQLRKVIVRSGNPYAYSISFSGNSQNIKTEVGNDELTDLDLTAFDHDYNSANVKLGLTDSLFTSDIVYNLLAKKQLYYNSDVADQTNTATLSNIAYNSPSQTNGILWNELRPAIKLNRILDAIETKYDINFTNDFFGRQEFDKLYLWLNKDKTNDIGITSQRVDFNGGDSDNVNFTTDVGTFSTYPFIADLVRWNLSLKVIPVVGFEDIPYKIKYYRNGTLAGVKNFTGQNTFVTSLNEPLNTYDVYFEIEVSNVFSYTTIFNQIKIVYTFPIPTTTTYTTTSSANTITSVLSIKNNLPKIKVIDFLKGLFKMFKLVVNTKGSNTIYVNDLNSYYAQGKLVDATKYIDFESVDIERGKILKEINFNFEEPKTILAEQFLENTNIAYGDEELLLTDQPDGSGQPLEGDTLEYEIPFEQFVYERLNDTTTNDVTNVQYGAIIDQELKSVNPKPNIFYNVSQDLGTYSIALINDSNTIEELTILNTPSHSIDFIDMPFCTTFGSEFSTWNGNLMSNTLYNNYHADYISSIFNIKRRSFKFKALLPLNIITSLQLNDVIKIREDYYRIDNFQTEITKGESTLNLINSFDNNLVGFNSNQTIFITDSNANRQTAYINKVSNNTITLIDNGFGTSWVSTSYNGNILNIDLDENTTLSDRTITIQLLEVDLKKTIDLIIIQNRKKTYRADSTFITTDTNLITVDNG